METIASADQTMRVRQLKNSLSQLRRETECLGAGDAIHNLRNAAMTAQGALHMVERRLAQGRTEEVDALLDLAETRLRAGRALVARTQLARFSGRTACTTGFSRPTPA